MSPTLFEKQGRRDKVLAVEKERKPSGDTGLPATAGDRAESRAYSEVAADRTLELLTDAQVGQSSSPSPSQGVHKGSEHPCVGLLLLVLTRITFSQSKALSIAATTV